jgi:3-dehydroquinate synthase
MDQNHNIPKPIILDEASWEKVNLFFSGMDFSNAIVLTDKHTKQYCLPVFRERVDFKFREITIESGEGNKTLDTVSLIWKQLLQYHAGRNSCLINLGGGVVGDMGGFAAATFKRGMHYVQIPTSLLAMTDSSIGGKTGFNFEGLKNNIGAFALPKAVFIYAGFLKTLPFSEIKNGWAEIIKHGFIEGKDLYDILIKTPDLKSIDWQTIIPLSVNIKQEIVSKDFKENQLRKVLNAGHTIGHSLESASRKTDKPLTHGEAVILGLKTELKLALQQSILPDTDFNQMIKILDFYFAGLQFPKLNFNQLIPYLQQDKKNPRKSVSFSLPENPGHFLTDRFFDLQSIQAAYESASQ